MDCVKVLLMELGTADQKVRWMDCEMALWMEFEKADQKVPWMEDRMEHQKVR